MEQRQKSEVKMTRTEASVYCPRCRGLFFRKEWRHVWRNLKSGTASGSPAEVLRHRICGEIVYIVLW